MRTMRAGRVPVMAHQEPNPEPPETPRSGSEEFELVRELLFGRETAQISQLQERLDNPEVRAQDVSRVLPEAVQACASDGDRLARALTPSVEVALQESVRRHPSILTNAIFPIIGPAIRRASADAISRLVQTVNQALDHSLSLRGLKWRFEALRTGKSYAEIVLCRTLVYRVEQVFLIQRSAGLLLQQVAQPDVTPQNSDVVSGMLTAIRDFVSDSFRVESGEGLHTLEVGGLSVWVESGPHAILAAVIRGMAPKELRPILQSALERIHRDFPVELSSVDASELKLAGTVPVLAECLVSQTTPTAGRSLRPFWLATGGVVLLVGGWGFHVFRDNHRWATYLKRLATEEGIVVSSTAKKGGRFHLVGWRDPFAVDPATLLAECQLTTNQIVAHWEPYQGLTPSLVLRRAMRVVQPPDGVALRFEGGVLHAEGVASRAWILEARPKAVTIPGVEVFDVSRVFDQTQAQIAEGVRSVESTLLFFEETTRLVPGQEGVLDGLIADLKELIETTSRSGLRFQVLIMGHSDRKGTTEYNQKLSQQRADEARALIESRGIPAEQLLTKGLGTTEPLRTGPEPAAEVQNRRVSFRVVLGPSSIGGPNP